MILQKREALVGTPVDGDQVKLVLEGDRTIYLTYKPGTQRPSYSWRVRENGAWPSELSVLIQGDEVKIFESYLEPDCPIAVGCPLEFVLVPDGNFANWPRATTDARVRSIELL